jgi:hypothetical protein
MNTAELVIWSAMLGGLVAIASFALIDALIRHRVASRRIFICRPHRIGLRAIATGDNAAWGILGASGLLTCAVAGLSAHALQLTGLGPPVWAATAACTVSFFMLGTFLALRRDRLNRQLERLAGLAQGDDAATGLPKGAVLLSKLDDAIWRGARNNRECTVICLRLANLYELVEKALQRLRHMMAKPLPLTGLDEATHSFIPRNGA